MSLILKNIKVPLGAKFRYRIAFNLAKESLLGKEHIPNQPQEKLFIKALAHTKFANIDGEDEFAARTFRSGWDGLRNPQEKTLSLLDDIVEDQKNNNHLNEWNKRSAKNIKIKTIEGTFDYTVIYYLGTETKPSKWINHNANNDVLHEHFRALEARCLIADSADKIKSCNKELDKIHQRWMPSEDNCFFEHFHDADDLEEAKAKSWSYSQYSSDYEHINMLESIRSREALKSIENLGGLTTLAIDKAISPKIPIEVYDFFSPASVCEYLAAIPVSINITNHPLLDFWILEFASSVLAVQGLADGFFWKNSDSYKTPKEMEDILAAGYELFWGESDIKVVLTHLNIHPNSIFYHEHYEAFSKFRARYAEIVNEFGISVTEIQDTFNDYNYLEIKKISLNKPPLDEHSKNFIKLQLKRMGDSLVMTIPKEFVEQNHLEEGSEVKLMINGDTMQIKATQSHKYKYKLNDLIAEMEDTPSDNKLPLVPGWDTMPVVGKEIV